MKDAFRSDIQKIRQRAEQSMSDGAVIGIDKADAARITSVLNDVLATETVCVLRYKNHAFMAKGLDAKGVQQEFEEHAAEEQQHADWVAARIVQLGGNPNLSPETMTARAHSEYAEADSLQDMLKEDLIAERIAIETYTEIIRWLGDDDAATRQLMVDILRVEEEHAEDLSSLLNMSG